MHRSYHRWFSPRLGREMELHVVGHAGARVLVFPTSQAPAHEWLDWGGMIPAIREPLERGWLQLFCLSTVDQEAWFAKWKHPGARAWRQTQYDQYLEHEVVPFTQHVNRDPFLITTGASFGAYHAVNFALRHPWLVGRVLSMSGMFDVKAMTDGYSDDNVYFNNPADFMRNEHDPHRLAAIRRMDIIVAVGEHDPNIDDNRAFCHTLWSKGIPCHLRVWHGWVHDWPYWRQMLPLYIGGHD